MNGLRIRSNQLAKASAFALTLLASPLFAADAMKLLDVTAEGVEKRFLPQWGSANQVSITRSQDPAAPGVVVNIKPGPEGFPGVGLKPEGMPSWDLSAYGHVEARVANLGAKPLSFSLRVDNAGDWQKSPWSARF